MSVGTACVALFGDLILDNYKKLINVQNSYIFSLFLSVMTTLLRVILSLEQFKHEAG